MIVTIHLPSLRAQRSNPGKDLLLLQAICKDKTFSGLLRCCAPRNDGGGNCL